MNIFEHYNVKELVVDCLDQFNQRLNEVNAPYRLADEADLIANNYNVYIAKKNGKPNDDYPCK